MDYNDRYSPNGASGHSMDIDSSIIVDDEVVCNYGEADQDNESIAYSDMQWSPIPTQSTLNNWNMLTQSLTQDQLDFGLDEGEEEEECVARPVEMRTPSPDMFSESPPVSQDVSMEGVPASRLHSEMDAEGSIPATYSKVQQHRCYNVLTAETFTETRLVLSSGINCSDTVPETPSVSMSSLKSVVEDKPIITLSHIPETIPETQSSVKIMETRPMNSTGRDCGETVPETQTVSIKSLSKHPSFPMSRQSYLEGNPRIFVSHIPETIPETQSSVFMNSLELQPIQKRSNTPAKLENTNQISVSIKCNTVLPEKGVVQSKTVPSNSMNTNALSGILRNTSLDNNAQPTRIYSDKIYDYLWYLNTIPETQNAYSAIVEPQPVEITTPKDTSDTIPETQLESVSHSNTIPETPPSNNKGPAHSDTIPETLNSHINAQIEHAICEKLKCDVTQELESISHLNTIPETLPSIITQVYHEQIVVDEPQSQIPRNTFQNGIIEKEVFEAPNDNLQSFKSNSETQTNPVTESKDNESTFCSLIERCTQITHNPNDETFCSTLENQPSTPIATLLALDLDPTFCSLVEMELQQSQPPTAEEFDFEEAIMRILDIAELPSIKYPENSPGSCASLRSGSQDSGTCERRSPRRNSQLSAPDVCARRLEHQQRIEQIILRFLMNLAGSDAVYLDVHRLGWKGGCTFNTASQTLTLSQDSHRSRCRTRHKIIMLLHLLQVVYNILGTSKLCTQRELYYNEPELTQNVDNISSSLREISCMLNTQPWQLGVLSTSKGLIAGPLRVELSNGEILNFESRHRGYSIPNLSTDVLRITSTARFILVVEKDTVFNKLLLDHIIGRFRNRCILLTGKGQPDISSRFWLNKLWQHLRLPIRVLCDADPHGIQIRFTYQFGSARLPMCSAQLAVPQCQWLGVRPTEIARLGLATRPLSAQDDRLLLSLMRRPYIAEHGIEELQWLQTHRRKASIEALDALASGYLLTYLEERLRMFLD